MTSVLVTGGTGLLGRRVTRALAADGHTVRILSRTAPGLPVPSAETVVGDLGTGRESPRRRPVLQLPLPGASGAALRAGANLVPGNASGGRTWPEFVAGRPQPVER
jgi:NAD(P)-dependent dehydrogenase (short-subunit alcohol dehydrogenase family)